MLVHVRRKEESIFHQWLLSELEHQLTGARSRDIPHRKQYHKQELTVNTGSAVVAGVKGTVSSIV